MAKKKSAGASAKSAAKGAANFNHVKRIDEATGGVFSSIKKYLKGNGMLDGINSSRKKKKK